MVIETTKNNITIEKVIKDVKIEHVILDGSGMNAVDYNYLYEHSHNTLYFTKSEITSLISEKADVIHVHNISDVNGLQTALDNKADDFDLTSLATKTELTTAQSEINTKFNNYRLKSTAINYNEIDGRPVQLNDLAQTSNYRLVSDQEKSNWNNKSTFSGVYSDLTFKPDLSKLNIIRTDGLASEFLAKDGSYHIGVGGTTDHSLLTNRDLASQHPISAITGLQTALDNKVIPTKLSDLSKDITFDERYYTEAEITSLLATKENAITKNTAFNKNFGTTSDTICQGNDARLSDSRTPNAHTQAISTITNLQSSLDAKQDLLISNVNLKTLGGQSLLGSGNIPLTGTGGGTTVIQNNGTPQPTRAALNIAGQFNKITDNATGDATNFIASNNIPKDWYINQNVYPALEWVWYHTDGYWYLVVMVLNQASGFVGNTTTKLKVFKTIDWISFIEVCSYENTIYPMVNPKICMDSNGNILVVAAFTSYSYIYSIFFDASNFYSVTFDIQIGQNVVYNIEATISLNVSSDNRFGVVFFQKHSGSTTYSQLMYVERSAGVGGTWGAVEILGATPVRGAATSSVDNSVQLFFTSINEPIILFFNNQSVTSSKPAIAKKINETWTIYDSTDIRIPSAIIDASNNVYFAANNKIVKFDYIANSFSTFLTTTANYLVNNSTNSDIFYLNYGALATPAIGAIFYRKNDLNTFYRAIRSNLVLGAVISANSYSTFGVYTVIPYSRQRLANAYHLVVRTDGAIYMEII